MANDDVVRFYGVKETIKMMRQVEPEMLKDLRKNIRQISAPGVSAIKSGSPTVAPLSGMLHSGRSAYSRPKVTIQVTPSKRSGFGKDTANLVAIKAVGSGGVYGFEIADMAGRANNPGKYPVSRQYTRNGRPQRHRLNGQGRAFIDNLNGRYAGASRFVYKNLEDKLPAIRQQVANVIESTMADFNRKLNK